MTDSITPTQHSSLVGGSTAARRIGCQRSYALEQYVTARGMRKRLTPTALRTLLYYDPFTGEFTWRPRPREWCGDAAAHARWNTTYADKPAFTTVHKTGYKRATLLGRTYVAHRIAWAIFYGEYPSGEIDHINHDKTDNRIANLRDVSGSENQKNRRLPADNRSGMIGVRWDKTRQKWRAYAYAEGRRFTLGYYVCWAKAYLARRMAEQRYGYHTNHGRRFQTT